MISHRGILKGALKVGAILAIGALACAFTPGYPLVAVVATGGTAVTPINNGATGCYIVNPLSTTDEGISPVEPLYIDPVQTAGTAGNGTTTAIAPGQAWACVPYSRAPSVNAATSGHKFSIVWW